MPQLAAQTSRDKEGEDDAGYIVVGVRLRPLMASRGSTVAVRIDKASCDIVCQKGASGKGEQRFPFSAVFEKEDNEALHDIVGQPLVESAIKGYNGCEDL